VHKRRSKANTATVVGIFKTVIKAMNPWGRYRTKINQLRSFTHKSIVQYWSAAFWHLFCTEYYSHNMYNSIIIIVKPIHVFVKKCSRFPSRVSSLLKGRYRTCRNGVSTIILAPFLYTQSRSLSWSDLTCLLFVNLIIRSVSLPRRMSTLSKDTREYFYFIPSAAASLMPRGF